MKTGLKGALTAAVVMGLVHGFAKADDTAPGAEKDKAGVEAKKNSCSGKNECSGSCKGECKGHGKGKGKGKAGKKDAKPEGGHEGH